MKRHVLPKTESFHTLFIKKKRKNPKRCCFKGTVGLLLPLDVRSRGRRRFFFFLCHRHLSLQKDADTTPICPKLSTCWRRGRRCVPRAIFGAAAQWPPQPHPSPVFAYKNGGGGRKKKRGGKTERRRREEREQKKEEEEAEKKMKNRGEKEKEKIEPPPTTVNRQRHHQCRCLSPPASPPTTAATTGQPFSPSSFSCFFSFPASLHCSRSM